MCKLTKDVYDWWQMHKQHCEKHEMTTYGCLEWR